MRCPALCALVLLATACGKRDNAAPAPVASAPSELAQAERAILTGHAARLTALARELEDTKSLDDAAAAVRAIHASKRWQRAGGREGYGFLIRPEKLENGRDRAREIAAAYSATGRALEGARTLAAIANAMQAAIQRSLKAGLGALSSDVVNELVYDRDLCAKPGEPSCSGVAAIDAAYSWLEVIHRASAGLDAVASDLDGALGARDVHLHVVLMSTLGRGPTFGATCGPEQLCRYDHECRPETGTCEHRCFMEAKNPCPASGLTCKEVPGLPGTFCRPP